MTRQRRLAPLVLALALGGCAGLFGAFDVAPSGLRTSDDRLRRLLASGDAAEALEKVAARGDADPGDELLRLLYEGLVAHYAREYAASNAAFERAVELAEDRYTKSLSRSAASLLTSDRILPFEPSPTERLMIPYYAALNYLSLEDVDGAAVEARRLSALLERYRDDDRADPRLHGLLRAFAGAVFEAAGDHDDADVAYRNARALGVDSVLLRPTHAWDSAPDSLGDVVVLIEQGFVAHRVEQSLQVLLLPEEIELFDDGDAGERAALVASIAARVVAHAAESVSYTGRRPDALFVAPPEGYALPWPRKRQVECPEPADTARKAQASETRLSSVDPASDPEAARGTTPAERAGKRGANAAREPAAARDCKERRKTESYLLRIAWPVYRRPMPATIPLTVALPDGRTEPLRARADLSDAVIRDFQAERTGILARTLARAITKLLVTRKLESEVGEEDETAGRVAGLVANVGTALLEQADTRSWHLLPGSIAMTRLRLPAGTHALSVPGAGPDGAALEIGQVEVRPGRIAFVEARAFRLGRLTH